ncbi:sushi, von Willebrand factor type A, EGF and pentraxin domain-containing protein 1-like [Wyeomyia smithii]|uniref:sushi, von Willebrand factor type A, EGF and pentraxin domain-containing protein 1-like n=1 Tax=Wyeomyia smithii TaxID=174621 RepID=UPI002467E55E|nr:sushi, von Willebrand factor type A, EGF and pentraxin domain-containing protein 1-like [Wyeomyia smithii]XP_055523738.1 sushi, von Willebrand factor type A, EGF and pentraxin domain-containing protein 1-like [Wyeomyia smithii]XP_055523739.1 sushi, von Willebrand factor type A, EGF and pentraxin domain-containing protein 1-like [Wyeomyia smithii]XP_055523740.1 sushi, von Willebrand factor type A, EGF and pentraxin domain-containing protein 1-like [Wyeomyia smithii]XP_055523741.1 sushi, von W
MNERLAPRCLAALLVIAFTFPIAAQAMADGVPPTSTSVEAIATTTTQGADDYQEYDDSVTLPTADRSETLGNGSRTTLPHSAVELPVYSSGASMEDLTVSNEILKNENSVIKQKVDRLSGVFKKNVEKIKTKHKRVDIVFLIDASSSVGRANFLSEIKFAKKLLSDFNVSYNYTRVAVVTFSSQKKILRHVDQISQSIEDNDKCLLLNYQIPKIEFSGGGTFTYGALKEAESIFKLARADSKKIIFLITDGFSNGRDPIPLAKALKRNNVSIYSIGIQSGNLAELYNISSSPGENYSYLLDSFNHFETLARKALHSDYKSGENTAVNSSLCGVLCSDDSKYLNTNYVGCCDRNATCSCSTSSGHYSCVCQPGYFGLGLHGSCKPCPNGTYWDDQSQCKSCPDVNHVTLTHPAKSVTDCVCKNGYKADEGGRCEVITCPELTPPENGYFVKQPHACGQVLNAACGTRCQSGYQLVGDSIRLCQENGSWSGNDPKCVLKTCPALKIPYYGIVVCKNTDLNLFFDYSPRNKSFIVNYSMSVDRSTERMPIDTDCTSKCGHGFYLVGSSSRNCLPLGKWDGLESSCKQILCPPLPKIPFGEYDPTDCAEQKSAHGSNCTLICNFGFELKGGPSTKSCGGKRNGVWTHKIKTPRCVDVTPPHLMCPNNYTLLMHDDFNYSIVKRLNRPYVFDNGGDNFTLWSKPAIKEQGTKLYNGTHLFTYVAVDSFKNKAKCNFTVTIIDRTVPVFENCYDPPVFYITSQKNNNESYLEWDEPTVYDNSNENVTVTASMAFGYYDVGSYQAIYRAEDSSKNVAECLLNITVKELKCGNLHSPPNGQTVCAKNASHTWCEITCDLEYTFHDRENNTLTLFCDNRNPKWTNESVPECTTLENPTAVEEIITISLGTDSETLCDNESAKSEVENMLLNNMKDQLCGTQIDCTITTAIPACENVDEPDGKSKYHLVKREATGNLRTRPKRPPGKRDDKATIKINVYTKLSKRLGLWKYDGKKSDNIKKIKTELQNINNNDKLRRRLGELNMDLSVLKLDESIRCPNGSVAKKLVCAECPRGTYHNHNSNMCTSCPIGSYNEITGQTDCVYCPPNHSTRKTNSKNFSECKPQCPPGTVAKLKVTKKDKSQKYHKSLMPFCRKCEPGEYQGLFNRISCDQCPPDHISPRGSTSITDCVPKRSQPCAAKPPVCGSHGQCIPEPVNDYLYSCTCNEGFVGSHCEKQLDICASAPCYNAGTCIPLNATSFRCVCSLSFDGEFCERFVDPCWTGFCQNGGSCIESKGRSICECPAPFEGDRCETVKNYCSPNPCEHGGTCHSDVEGFSCSCSPGRMGKRCHLKPCDYMPCPSNSICVDIGQIDTDKYSYQCVCPKGLRGHNCTEVDNPCEKYPCKNNGVCTPVKLRDPNLAIGQHVNLDGDELYTKVTCDCPPYFYGSRCEVFTTPDFVISFENSGITNYAKLEGPNRNLSEISLCTWIQTKDDFNYGAVISYATSRTDNEFTFTDYSGFVLYIAGQYVVTNVYINDGMWHFICLAWTNQRGLYEIFLDGELHTTGYGLSSGKYIEGNGLFVIGQEQDLLGGGFSDSEAFLGKLAYLDVWSRALNGYEVKELYYSCEPYQGDLIKWTDLKFKLVGNVRLQKSEFCRVCEKNLTLQNGYIEYYGNRAYLRCDEGYKLHGSPEVNCLRTSRWSETSSFCKLIRCGSLGSILNGRVILSKTSYNGIARFVCDDGFYIAGAESARCTLNSTWSAPLPECISAVKCPSLETSEKIIVIYASERGVLRQSFTSYAVGTLAEVKCADSFYLDGENLLTCLDTGNWDLAIPRCIARGPEETTTELVSRLPNEKSKTPNIIKINRRTDVRFWKQLKDYLFYGCKPVDSKKISHFCLRTDSFPELDDLTTFELPVSSSEYQNMDHKLLEKLEKTTKPEGTLRVNNFLNFILYGTTESSQNISRMSRDTENAYRFIICLFIDIIMMDREVSLDQEIVVDINTRENTNEKIKSLLKNVVQPIYEIHVREQEEGRQREAENQRNALKKILALVEVEPVQIQKCKLNSIPDPPIDSKIIVIESKTVELRASDIKMETLRKRDELLGTGDRIRYGCNLGFTMKGSGYVECTPEGQWSYFDSFCEGVLCQQPSVPTGMKIAASSVDSQYYYDDEIEYHCQNGYTMQGHPIIKCSVDGMWSPIMARCTKISCGKPKISSTSKIISGISYQFGETLRILCEGKQLIEITCLSTGKWNAFSNC